jgi:hypothetical protein
MRVERDVLKTDHRAGVGGISVQQERTLPDTERMRVMGSATYMYDDGV